MSEIASLVIEIDVSAVEEATDALGQFIKMAQLSAKAGAELGKASREMTSGMETASAEVAKLSEIVRDSARVYDDYARAAKEADKASKASGQAQAAAAEAHEKAAKAVEAQRDALHDLGKSLLDTGKAMAKSEEPMSVLVDKAPELAKSFLAAKESGLTFKSALSLIGGDLGGVVAALGPVGIGVAAVAGLFAGGLAVATDGMNKKFGDLTAGMGLTEEQLGRVKDKGITMGDTLQGVFDVASKHLGETFGPMLEAVGGWLGQMFQKAIDGYVAYIRAIVGGIGGAVGAIRAVWSRIPDIFMEFIINAANGVLGVVQSMVNGIIDQINGVAGIINAAAGALGMQPIFGKLDHVQIAPLVNAYKGAGAEAVAAMGKGFDEGSKAALAGLDKTAAAVVGVAKGVQKEVEAATVGEAKKRIGGEAGSAAKAAGGRSGGGGRGVASGADTAKDAVADYQKLIDAGTTSAETLNKQAKQQQRFNDLVAAGTMTTQQATAALKQENDLQAYVDAEAAARGANQIERADQLKAAREALAKATDAKNAAEADKAVVAIGADQDKEIARLRTELDLVGKTNAERAEGLAAFKAEQDLKGQGYDPKTANAEQQQHAADVIAKARAIVKLQEEIRAKTEAANGATKDQVDLTKQAADQAQKAAQALAGAFDGVSDSLKRVFTGVASVIGTMSKLAEQEKAINKKRQQDLTGLKEGSEKYNKVEQAAAEETAKARVGAYGDMAAAAKGFFDQNSAGYKVMQAAEIAFRAIEMVMSIKAMAQATLETANDVKSSGLKATASGIAAYAKSLASLPFPFNLAAGAVVLAALAGIGVAITGGGGAAPGANDAEHRQDAQGAGSVLGDSKAKSESIKKSLELVADHTNTMLEFYNPMLAALRSIDSQIGNLAAALARSLGVGGMLDTSTLGLGASGKGPSLSNLGFGSVTTRTLQDQGLNFSAGTLGAILAGGIQGKTYQQILSETKKSAFGLTYSTSTSKKTINGALDPEFARQTTLLIGSLRDGVLSAASVLGIEGAAATLDAFKLDLGKISLKDLKGDEITAALEAVFGKAADGMAAAVMPGLVAFQKVGEGAFETLTRLARDYQVVDVTLTSIGKQFGAVGVGSVEARERLVALSGGLDSFTDQAGFYAENFLSEAERLAPVQAAVAGELARLGLTGIKTRDQFKAVVQGLDVSTQAGAELYAALMTLAPAFAAVTQESQALSDAKDTLSGAYDRESGALKDTHDRFADLARSLHDFGAGLYSGPAAALSPEEQYRAAQAAFQATAGLAAQGNEKALGDLQGVSQSYLDASKAYFASSEGYFADLAAVRDAVSAAEASAGAQVDVAQAQLDAMAAQVSQLIELNTHVVSVAEAIAALQALMGGGTAGTPQTFPAAGKASNDNTAAVVTAIQDLQTEVAGVNDQLSADKTQRAAIAQQNDARLAALEDQLAAMRRAAQA